MVSQILAAAAAASLFWSRSVGANGGDDCTTIAALAAGEPTLSTLVALVDAAGLSETLEDPEADLTVFAPTNDAFALLGTVEELTGMPEAALKQVLEKHIVAGATDSAALMDGQELQTLDPATTATVGKDDESVTLTVGDIMATVTGADNEACLSVVHIIDGVLDAGPGQDAGAMAPGPAGSDGNCTTAFERVSTMAMFSTLAEAIMASDVAAGLADALSEPDADLTIFAPTNTAFTSVEGVAALLNDTAALTTILENHVVSGFFTSADLMSMNGDTLTTVGGLLLTVTVTEDVVTITAPAGGSVATVTMANVEACSSIIHQIDTVLVVGAADAGTPGGDSQTGAGTDTQTPDGDVDSGASGLVSGVSLVAAAAIAAALV